MPTALPLSLVSFRAQKETLLNCNARALQTRSRRLSVRAYSLPSICRAASAVVSVSGSFSAPPLPGEFQVHLRLRRTGPQLSARSDLLTVPVPSVCQLMKLNVIIVCRYLVVNARLFFHIVNFIQIVQHEVRRDRAARRIPDGIVHPDRLLVFHDVQALPERVLHDFFFVQSIPFREASANAPGSR